MNSKKVVFMSAAAIALTMSSCSKQAEELATPAIGGSGSTIVNPQHIGAAVPATSIRESTTGVVTPPLGSSSTGTASRDEVVSE